MLTRATKLLLLVCVIVSLLSGCGNANRTQTYIMKAPTSVVLIQMTDSNGTINGSWQVSYIPSTTAKDLTVHDFQITGNENGSSIIIEFPDKQQPYSGTISGNKLTLNVPNTDGTIKEMVFTKGTVDDYNKDVKDVQNKLKNQQ